MAGQPLEVFKQLASWLVTEAVYLHRELKFPEGYKQIAELSLKRKATKAEVAEVTAALKTWASLTVKDRNEEEGWISLTSWVVMYASLDLGTRIRPKQEVVLTFGPVIRHTMGLSEEKKQEVIDKMVGWAHGDTTDFVTDEDFAAMAAEP